MQELSMLEIDEVSGGRPVDVAAACAGALIGSAVGFFVGGPVGAVVGGIDAAVHAVAISRAML